MALIASMFLLAPVILKGQEGSFYDFPPVLRTGDMIRIQVWRQPEFSGEFRITADGRIAHPLLQDVVAAGRDVAAVERDVETFLRQYVDQPSIIVEGMVVVPISGEVRSPDLYSLRLDTSIARAIAIAGGPTQRGDLHRIIIRRGGEAYRIDLNSTEVSFRELQVRSGDEIVLERRTDWFRDHLVPWLGVTGSVFSILRYFRR